MPSEDSADGTSSAANRNLRRRKFLLGTAAANLFGLAGCAGNSDGGSDGTGGDDDSDGGDDGDGSGQVSIELASGTQGTNAYDTGLGILRAVEDHSDTLNLTITEGGGYVNQAYLYDSGEINAVALNNNTIVQARNEEGPFADEPIDIVPAQGFWFQSSHIYLLAVEGSGVESTADIDGDVVYPLQPGWGARELTETILEDSGIAERAEYLNVDIGDLPGAIEEDRVDVIAITAANFQQIGGWVQEIDVRSDVNAIETSDEFVQAIESHEGARHIELEPYGWEQDVTETTEQVDAIVNDAQMFFGDDVESEAVYELARIAYENQDTVRDAAPHYPNIDGPSGLTQAILDEHPIHEGAAQYYKDEDVWNDEWTIANEYDA